MKIYVAHSREFDYEKELYHPIRSDQNLPQTDIILPHEAGQNINFGRKFYSQLDLVIAEVSYAATGLGIELAWAYDAHVPIICISKSGARISGSLHAVCDHFYEYANTESLIKLVEDIISHHEAGEYHVNK